MEQQRRRLTVLFITQIIGGVGIGVGLAVGVLFAKRQVGDTLSGFAGSAMVIGAALLAIPAAIVLRRWGRRLSLSLPYLLGCLGSVLLVVTAYTSWAPLLFAGMFCFGGATAANLQARFAAVDLAPEEKRARHLAIIVWATTVGAVFGPILAAAVDRSALQFGLPSMAGPFLLSAIAFGVAGLIVLALLRSQPPAAPTTGSASRGPMAAVRIIMAVPSARLGLLALVVGNFVMMAIMVMTPVHVDHGTSDSRAALNMISIIISLHVVGMYAFAPLIGYAADRFGRRTIAFAGGATLLTACVVAMLAGHGVVLLSIALLLVGLGWAATLVSGSALVNESIEQDQRPTVQGLSDLCMGLASAVAGVVAGILVGFSGYRSLATICAVVALALLIAAAIRPARMNAATS